MPKAKRHTMHLEREGTDPDGRALYICTSEHDDEPLHPTIDLCSGAVFCDCRDFTCRKSPKARREQAGLNIGNMRCLCKHLHLAVGDCIRRGEIRVTLEEVTPECEEFHLWPNPQTEPTT